MKDNPIESEKEAEIEFWSIVMFSWMLNSFFFFFFLDKNGKKTSSILPYALFLGKRRSNGSLCRGRGADAGSSFPAKRSQLAARLPLWQDAATGQGFPAAWSVELPLIRIAYRF